MSDQRHLAATQQDVGNASVDHLIIVMQFAASGACFTTTTSVLKALICSIPLKVGQDLEDGNTSAVTLEVAALKAVISPPGYLVHSELGDSIFRQTNQPICISKVHCLLTDVLLCALVRRSR